MLDPKYKPQSWVLFKMGTSQAFGRIEGGVNNGDFWYYFITNASSIGQNGYTIKEEDIIKIIL